MSNIESLLCEVYNRNKGTSKFSISDKEYKTLKHFCSNHLKSKHRGMFKDELDIESISNDAIMKFISSSSDIAVSHTALFFKCMNDSVVDLWRESENSAFDKSLITALRKENSLVVKAESNSGTSAYWKGKEWETIPPKIETFTAYEEFKGDTVALLDNTSPVVSYPTVKSSGWLSAYFQKSALAILEDNGENRLVKFRDLANVIRLRSPFLEKVDIVDEVKFLYAESPIKSDDNLKIKKGAEFVLNNCSALKNDKLNREILYCHLSGISSIEELSKVLSKKGQKKIGKSTLYTRLNDVIEALQRAFKKADIDNSDEQETKEVMGFICQKLRKEFEVQS
ncbi:MAG: hypothetical protein JNL74_08375 [Fibrobacteres bacterium]|nr:hypothetical protein [Fibrobacterota bacterium]